MNEMPLNLSPNNVLIKNINHMVQGKVDAIGVGFEHLLSDDDSVFKSKFNMISELFEESMNSIETIAAVPINPFVRAYFYNWVKSFSVDDVVSDVSKLGISKSKIAPPQYLVCQAQVSMSKQPHGQTYELELRVSLVNKDQQHKNAWLYPVAAHTFVLSQYQGDMRS